MNPLSTCDLCDAHRDAPDERFRVLPPIFRDRLKSIGESALCERDF